MNNKNKRVGIAKPYRPKWRSVEDDKLLPIYIGTRRYVPLQYNQMYSPSGKTYASICTLKNPMQIKFGKDTVDINHILVLGKAALHLSSKELQSLVMYETLLFKYESDPAFRTRFNFAGVDYKIIRFNGIAEVEARNRTIQQFGDKARDMFKKIEKLSVKSQKATGCMLREELGRKNDFKFVKTTNADFMRYIRDYTLLPDVDEELSEEMGDSVQFTSEEDLELINDISEMIDLDEVIASVV